MACNFMHDHFCSVVENLTFYTITQIQLKLLLDSVFAPVIQLLLVYVFACIIQLLFDSVFDHPVLA